MHRRLSSMIIGFSALIIVMCSSGVESVDPMIPMPRSALPVNTDNIQVLNLSQSITGNAGYEIDRDAPAKRIDIVQEIEVEPETTTKSDDGSVKTTIYTADGTTSKPMVVSTTRPGKSSASSIESTSFVLLATLAIVSSGLFLTSSHLTI